MPRTTRTPRPLTVALATGLTMALLGASSASAITPPTPRPTAQLAPAPAHLPQTPTVDTTRYVVDLTFPVAEPGKDVRFIDDFLQLRGGGVRLHAATDVMAPKHRPIHAAVGGTITSAPTSPARYGWAVHLLGDDGLRYTYIHLNDDTPKRDAAGRWLDDDKGGMANAYAPRIVQAIKTHGNASGLRIERGELIGFNGDSGNAKGVAPHLHLEIAVDGPDGRYRINPYHSLKAALQRGDVPGELTPAPSGEAGFGDVFAGAAHTTSIVRLSEAGVVTGCRPARFCPHEAVTRGDLAAFLAAARGLAPTGAASFADVKAGHPNAGAIAAVVDAGLLNGYGTGRFGPDDPLSRAQLATVLVQGFGLPSHAGPAPFDDVAVGGTHSANIAAAHAAGLTAGCDEGRDYCGTRSVTRGQVASFLDAARNRG